MDSVEEENEDAETSVGDAEMPTGDAETPVENVETRAVDAEMTVEKDWFWDGIGIAGEEEGDAERNVDHQSQAEKQPNNGGKGVETNVDKGPAAAGCGGRSTAADGRGLLKNAETAADEGGGGPTCCWKRPKLMVSTTFAAVGKGPASMETPPGHSAATSALTSSTFRQQQQRELVPPSSSSASVTALVASSSAPATANANEAEEERAARRVAIENTIVDDFNELSCAELMDILLDDCFDDEDEDQLQQNAVESDGEHEDDQQPGERHH